MIYIDCEDTDFDSREFEDALDNMVVDWCSYENLEEGLDIEEVVGDNEFNDLEDY